MEKASLPIKKEALHRGTGMNDNKTRIREFFSRFFRIGTVSDSDDIFASGHVNSLLAVQLIAWLEKDFAITIGDEDLQMSNFNSIDAIEALISRKQQAAATA
jgi:acyl carrier protein